MVPKITVCGGIFLAFVVLGVTGCSDNPKPDASDEGPQRLVIAAIPKSTGGEFWETVEQGARDAAEELDVELKWEGTLTENEIAEQTKLIENMINLEVDGLALAPLNAKAMKRSVESAVDAGIPVVIFDSAVDGDAHTSFVATNNEKGGELAGEFMAQQLAAGEKRVLLLRYIQGTASTEDRAAGFLKAAEQGGLNVVDDPYPEDSTVAGCKKTAANVLETYVKDGKLQLEGIFACNLYSTLGGADALEDLRASGVTIELTFVGFDTSPKLLDYLKQGSIKALVAQDPRRMGFLAVETMVKHLRKVEVEPFIDTGVELVTQERLDKEPALRKLVGLE